MKYVMWLALMIPLPAAASDGPLNFDELSKEAVPQVMLNVSEEQAYCSALLRIFAHCANQTEAGAGDQLAILSDQLIQTGPVLHMMATEIYRRQANPSVAAMTDAEQEAALTKANEVFMSKLGQHASEINAEVGSCTNLVALKRSKISWCRNTVVGNTNAHMQSWIDELSK